MAKIVLSLTNPSHPAVEVDGVLVGLATASRVSVDLQPGRTLPTLYVEVPAQFADSIQFEGAVEKHIVTEAPALDFASALEAFLDKLDPGTLESMMLERQTAGLTSMGPGQAVIEVLRQIVRPS